MNTETLKVYREGRPTYLDTITVSGTTITLHGSLLRTAKVHDEWFNTPESPGDISRFLRQERLADLFTFWQLPPDVSATYDFPMEWVAISALPLTSYEHWFTDQIRKEVRKNIKKSARRGVEIRRIEFDDDLVSGITRIFNEAKVRQGRLFWHYGKGAREVKAEMGQDLERSHFIGAYFEGELIGFFKLRLGKCFAQPVVSLSMLKHRDKYADTALISEAVKFCSERGLQYLTYGEWRRDSHKEFLESHGFSKVLLPRYYVALTPLGSFCLKVGTHKGMKEFLKELPPQPALRAALTLRSRWYRWRFGTAKG